MMSPLAFAAVVAGVVWMAMKRQPADKFLLSYLGVYGAFFLVFNFHAYYFLPLAPMATLGVGAARLRHGSEARVAGGAGRR